MHFTLEQLGILDSMLSTACYALSAVIVPILLEALF